MPTDYVEPPMAPSPDVSSVVVRGLATSVLTWEPAPGAPATGLTVLLLHGFQDAAATFDGLAEPLAAVGHRVVAPDLRGFGDTAAVPASGYYHFPDYVADVRALVARLAAPRLAIVGHSMGGTIACMVAGLGIGAPERLVLLEGLGPPAQPAEGALDRFRAWLAGLDAVEARPRHRTLSSLDEAVERLRANHPGVPVEVLRTRAPLLTRPVEGGRIAWKFDPLHRTTAPLPFMVEAFASFLDGIACPTLVVGGGPMGSPPEDEAARGARIRDARTLDLPTAGHMMHWTAAAELGAAIVAFLAEAPG